LYLEQNVLRVSVYNTTWSDAVLGISRYQTRFSGLLLDRIDIHVEVPRVPSEKLM
jgi:predicted ATPase with chaperone activity